MIFNRKRVKNKKFDKIDGDESENDYFDREVKVLFFNQEEGRLFYQKLADTIEEIESSFFDDLFEYEDDGDDEVKM